MRNLLYITLILLTTQLGLSQPNKELEQDSLYKLLKVKTKKKFDKGKKLVATYHYNQDGNITSLALAPTLEGMQMSTFYSYDPNGKLSSIADTIRYGQLDKESFDRIKSEGGNTIALLESIAQANKDKKPSEAASYQIVYEGNKLTRLARNLPNGQLDWETLYDTTKRSAITKRYLNGVQVFEEAIAYESSGFPKELNGWERKEDYQNHWSNFYQNVFNAKKQLVQRTLVSPEYKETTSFEYYANGLLKSIQSSHLSENYLYEFYR